MGEHPKHGKETQTHRGHGTSDAVCYRMVLFVVDLVLLKKVVEGAVHVAESHASRLKEGLANQEVQTHAHIQLSSSDHSKWDDVELILFLSSLKNELMLVYIEPNESNIAILKALIKTQGEQL